MSTDNNDSLVAGNKWLSRKFITSIVTLGCLIAGNIMDFDGNQLAVLLIPLIYVVIEGIIDAVKIIKDKDK